MDLSLLPIEKIPKDVSKLSNLYTEAIKINRNFLTNDFNTISDLLKKSSIEVQLLFNEVTHSIIELINRIRNFKLEILMNIPHVNDILSKKKNYQKLSNLIYEYIFSGFAICMLKHITNCNKSNKIKKKPVVIDVNTIWEIFATKAAHFKIPQVHTFFSNPKNSDIVLMINLLFSLVSNDLKREINDFNKLDDELIVFICDIVEKSLIEGILLFEAYEEAKNITSNK